MSSKLKKIKRKKMTYQGLCINCGNISLVELIIKKRKTVFDFAFGCECHLDIDLHLFDENEFCDFIESNFGHFIKY